MDNNKVIGIGIIAALLFASAKGIVDNIAEQIDYRFAGVKFIFRGFLGVTSYLEINMIVENNSSLSATLESVSGEVQYGNSKLATVSMNQQYALNPGDNPITLTINGIVGGALTTILGLITSGESALQPVTFIADVDTSLGSFEIDETVNLLVQN